jgi:transducin (beta)-like 1
MRTHLLGICLDLDWLDEELFASCSADKVIHVLSIHRADPVAILTWVHVSYLR